MRALLVATVATALIGSGANSARCAEPQDQDVAMLLMNFHGPFVTRDFAEHLGRLVVTEKYKGALLADDPPGVQDKGDVWWVTVKVQRWVTPPNADKLLPSQITVWIRKKDAAIISIR